MEAKILWKYLETDGIETQDENKWNMIRSYRNELLTRCDWTQLADAPITPYELDEWRIYRQTLRDLPELYETPDEVVFPTPPEGDA
jgi:hypothetical protein